MRGRTDSLANRRAPATAAWVVACVSTLFLTSLGCGRGRINPRITSDDPSEKIPGIVVAVKNKDLPKARQMVEDLASDDAAVRMFAIGGLRRLTGETFGYNYYDDEDGREPALKKWQEWLEVQQAAD